MPEVVDRIRRAGCVFAEEEADLLIAESATPDQLAAAVDQRVDGLLLEQVLGWAAFCGLRGAVAPASSCPSAVRS